MNTFKMLLRVFQKCTEIDGIVEVRLYGSWPCSAEHGQLAE
jgi:hypothetical protein